MIIFLISTLTAIVISFLCSLTEAVLLGLNKLKVESDKDKGAKYAITLNKLTSNINRPISAILILNTIAHTGGATVAGSAFDETFGTEYIWIFSLIFTFVVLFGTEIFPKVYGVSHTDDLAKYIASPLNIVTKILSPIIIVTELFSRLIVKKKYKPQYTLEDMHTIAKVAERENIIDKVQEEIIVKTTSLKSLKLKEIMLPMNEVILFSDLKNADGIYATVREHHHTRYPYSPTGSPQDIQGYINFKEIAIQGCEIKDDELKNLLRPIVFADKNMNVMKLMKQLKRKRFHIIIVQDENKQNIGMLTLEDIVEEVVGEILDEFDIE